MRIAVDKAMRIGAYTNSSLYCIVAPDFLPLESKLSSGEEELRNVTNRWACPSGKCSGVKSDEVTPLVSFLAERETSRRFGCNKALHQYQAHLAEQIVHMGGATA